MLAVLTDQNYGQTVRQDGDYVLAYSAPSWCGPCRELHPHLQAIAMQYVPRGVKVFEVDEPRSKRTMRELRINSFPTVVVARVRNGQVITAKQVHATNTLDRAREIRSLLQQLGYSQ